MNIDRKVIEQALEALESIALAGMSGSGQESEEGMREWHARQAWKFIGIAARSLDSLREALAQPQTLNGHGLFQDAEGTTPVTAIGQQVGFVAQPLIPPSGAGVFLEAPLAQPQTVQEPVARVRFSDGAFDSVDWIPYQGQLLKNGDFLYTTPKAQQPLTDVGKDAARYRWLRSTTNYVTSNGNKIDVRNQPELWDSTIDAAIEAAHSITKGTT